MKQMRVLFFMVLVVPFLSSCDGEKPEYNVIVEPIPVPVCFVVKDADGNNLLDADFKDNLLSNEIKVTYKGVGYPLVLSEWNGDEEIQGLYTGKVGDSKTPGVMLWYFCISDDPKEKTEFTINWGDGTSDSVAFYFYYTAEPEGDSSEPKVHKRIYLNEKLHSDRSLTVAIEK